MPNRAASGFTLIELIIVIIILGILSVTAAPRFINLTSDARLAALNGMLGAVNSANNLTVSYARVKRTPIELNQDLTMPDGSVVRLDYGYPEHSWETAWINMLEGTFTLKTSGGMCEEDTDWCVDSDFNIGADISVPGSSSATVFWPKGTDTADNCYVYYAFSASARGNVPSIGKISDGC